MDDFEDSPWADDADTDVVLETDASWAKISSEFTNAGYREGITAGKESALQEGFDDAFARVGAPIGRELGLLRGYASAAISYLNSTSGAAEQVAEARSIGAALSAVRFSDIAPRDREAEAHAREHLETDDGEPDDARVGAADLLAEIDESKPRDEDLKKLKERLEVLCRGIGLDLTFSS
ncbi:hypothetical protein PLICRDRAFT_106317 [Plicaturopsis crispa FD-325 SS-3]|nr:hypothetical protein PLICRDRAFT_106317 [Plicaturopsis crispa FD-325 SS-3]